MYTKAVVTEWQALACSEAPRNVALRHYLALPGVLPRLLEDGAIA
jgi:hypothetical protein